MPPEIYDHSVVFDTNIFNRMISGGGEEYQRTVFRNLQDAEIGRTRVFQTFVTPFLLMEYMGVAPPSPDLSQLATAIRELGPREASDKVYELAEAHFEQVPQLAEAYLRQIYARQEELSHAPGKNLLRDVIGSKVSRDGFSRLLIQNLALDYQYGFNYRSELTEADVRRIHVTYMVDLWRMLREKMNLSPARGLIEVSEMLKRRNRGIIQLLRDLLSLKQGLALYGDRGDLDMLHLSVLGGHLTTGPTRVLAVTGDPLDVVRRRLVGYKNLAHHSLDLLRGVANQVPNPEPAPNVLEGKVAVLDQQTAAVLEVIEVSQFQVTP